jgi:hypothetical protein
MTVSTLPTIRILHTMGRSGGTLVSKCLGCMENIILLSEIHPLSTESMKNPLYQANKWFNLFSEQDLLWLKNNKKIYFLEAIELIYKKCIEKNKILVIRDLSHIDFIARPFLTIPSYKLTLFNILKQKFNIIHTAQVRHPIDQWLSIRLVWIEIQKIKKFREIEIISLEAFLYSYRKFSEYCVAMGFIKYEDFTKNPETKIKNLCKNLQIEYDPKFKDNWKNYKTITGDINIKEYSRGAGNSEIKVLPRREIEKELYERFISNPDYIKAISLLGYEN